MPVNSRFMFKPVWAFVCVLLMAVVESSVPGFAAAIGRFLGYVPEVGLVENTGKLNLCCERIIMERYSFLMSLK